MSGAKRLGTLPCMNENILTRILDEASAAKRSETPFLAVFDLDSTLFDLTSRMGRIVDAFADDPKFQKRYPKDCASLKNLPIKPSDWGLSEALARVGIKKETHAELVRELHEHWTTCFFSDGYLAHDEPLPGAVSYVQRLRRGRSRNHVPDWARCSTNARRHAKKFA